MYNDDIALGDPWTRRVGFPSFYCLDYGISLYLLRNPKSVKLETARSLRSQEAPHSSVMCMLVSFSGPDQGRPDSTDVDLKVKFSPTLDGIGSETYKANQRMTNTRWFL